MSYGDIKVKHIVATDRNGCIGKEGDMPWHVPADLRRFRELTLGGVVIMGRKTFDSIGGRSLKDRMNIVVGTSMPFDDYYQENANLIYCDNINDALVAAKYYAKDRHKDHIWVIGGAQIYEQTMKYVDEIEHTLVNTEIVGGDAFYPDREQSIRPVWVSGMISSSDSFDYQFSTYLRFKRNVEI